MSDYPAVIPMIAYRDGPKADGEHGKRYRVEDLEGHRWMFMERR
jgi:hypothetical protein